MIYSHNIILEQDTSMAKKHLIKTSIFTSLTLSLMVAIGAQSPALAETKSRILPIETYLAMLAGNKETGWVAFRNYNGSQWIYFTALQTLHCRLKEIRYSINSKDLDQRFKLVKCNPQNPFALPPDSGPEDTAMNLPDGAAKTIAVQVLWEDDNASEIAVYEPCKDVGDQSCAWHLE